MRTVLPLAWLAACSAPTATHTETRFDALDLEEARGEVRFLVDNPWPVGLTLTGFSYDLRVADRPILTGLQQDGLRIDAWEQAEVGLPVTVRWSDLRRAWDSSHEAGAVPWSVQGTVGVATWWGETEIPLAYAGSLPVLQRPRIGVADVRFGRGAEGGVGLALELRITRDGGMDWSLDDLRWMLALADRPAAAGRAHTRPVDDLTTALTVEVLLDPLHAASQVASLLAGYPVEASIRLVAQLTTPLGTFPLDTTVDQTLAWR